MTIRAFVSALLGLSVAACAGGDDDDGVGPTDSSSLGTCAIRADVTGGTTIHFAGKDDAACATLHSFDSGLDALFIGTNAKGTLELIVDDVLEGETGSDFPTRVVVTSTEKAHWQSAGCLTSISEHELLEIEASEIGELRHHQVSGEGSCPEPLVPESAGDDGVMLGPFTFRAQFTWRD